MGITVGIDTGGTFTDLVAVDDDSGRHSQNEIPSPVTLPTGCYLHPRCPFALELCSTERTTLKVLAPGRMAACHRAHEFVSGAAEEEMLTSPRARGV